MESPTESDLEISHLTTNDIGEIVEIESASFTIPWTFQMVSEELANPRSNCYKLTLSNEVIGYFCFWAVLDEAHLMNIAIHPDHRKQGYGAKLMSILETFARGMNLTKILLEVARGNKPARKLYKKMGYKSVGFRKAYYVADKQDAILMEKSIIHESEE
jgi:[ribosomal protein S18]-alanine N-acetyltransferase